MGWNPLARIAQTTDLIARQNQHLMQEIATMQQELQDIADAVRANTDATAAAVTFISQLADKMKDAVTNQDGPQIEKLANDLKANSNALAQAITANTPADSSSSSSSSSTSSSTPGAPTPSASADAAADAPNTPAPDSPTAG